MTESFDHPSVNATPLGKHTDYPQEYAPELLCPIPRQPSREKLGIGAALPFVGEDIWNAYELSWLNRQGKPVVAEATFRVPADSPAIIESKSLKLYLNSLNQSAYASMSQVENLLQGDLSRVAGSPVAVSVRPSAIEPLQALPGVCLDTLDISVSDYQVNPAHLRASGAGVEEQLHSHLMRSLCPVTGQPDWASVLVEYRGPAIDREGLLRYLVSYRQHQAFHEQCVEQMFVEISEACQPEFLSVAARYLRRGGLDINPVRSSEPIPWVNLRLPRQ